MRLLTPLMAKRNNLFIRLAALLVPALILCGVLAPTAFAQNTFVITDGDQVIVHTTYASDPAQVLTEAGFQLDEEDFYTTADGDGVSEITVQRGQNITINNCGTQMQVSSYGETVEELLTRQGVPCTGDYRVSPPLNAATYDGMQIVVEYVVQNQETYTVEIPFEETVCYDPTRAAGEREVIVPGVPGQMQCVANVTYINTQETDRTVLEQTVIQEPVEQIVVEGTGEELGKRSNMPLIGDGVIVTASGEVLTYTSSAQFKATAYTHTDEGCDNITATGTQVHVGVVAVDPTVVPYGTRMFIVTNDGSYVYGIGTAEDCGGGVKGNHVDLYFDTDAECWQFGVRQCTIYFLGDVDLF